MSDDKSVIFKDDVEFHEAIKYYGQSITEGHKVIRSKVTQRAFYDSSWVATLKIRHVTQKEIDGKWQILDHYDGKVEGTVISLNHLKNGIG